jgi:hypothetical protein
LLGCWNHKMLSVNDRVIADRSCKAMQISVG